jgi:hypothetical protein
VSHDLRIPFLRAFPHAESAGPGPRGVSPGPVCIGTSAPHTHTHTHLPNTPSVPPPPMRIWLPPLPSPSLPGAGPAPLKSLINGAREVFDLIFLLFTAPFASKPVPPWMGKLCVLSS